MNYKSCNYSCRYKICLHIIDVLNDGIAEPNLRSFRSLGHRVRASWEMMQHSLWLIQGAKLGIYHLNCMLWWVKDLLSRPPYIAIHMMAITYIFKCRPLSPYKRWSSPTFLPLSTSSTTQKDGQCSSSEVAPTDIPQGTLDATQYFFNNTKGWPMVFLWSGTNWYTTLHLLVQLQEKNILSPSVTYKVSAIESNLFPPYFSLHKYMNNTNTLLDIRGLPSKIRWTRQNQTNG